MAAAAPLVPRLPRSAWLVLAGDTLSAVGSGLTLPFFLVYLTRIRGIDVVVAGLALATVAVISFVASPIGGMLIDRLGARRALVVGLVISGTGALLVTVVNEPWHAFVAAAGVGFGAGIVVPALDSLLATVVVAAERSSAFALRNATLNAGYGLGGLAAAFIADLANPQSFVTLYVIDGLTFFAFIPVLVVLLPRARQPQSDSRDHAAATTARGGYRSVLSDRVFLRFWALIAFLVAIGFAQSQAGFPVFATNSGVSAAGLGIALAANTFTVVGAQLFILRFMAGRRRTTGIVLACACWGAAWAMTLVAGGLGGGATGVVAFSAVMVVFALGETFLAPSQAALLNDLAPDALRGRYNAIYTLAWSTGYAVGPAGAGAALSLSGGGTILFGGLIIGCGVGAVAALRLARHLPPSINVVSPSRR